MPAWLKPLWAILARTVKTRLHALVDAVEETDIYRFRLLLHERIERL